MAYRVVQIGIRELDEWVVDVLSSGVQLALILYHVIIDIQNENGFDFIDISDEIETYNCKYK